MNFISKKLAIIFSFFLIIGSTLNLSASSSQDSHRAFEEGLMNVTYYETPQGHLLRYAHFKSPGEGPKNTVFFLQGRGTFLEFYESLVTPLLERDFDVWMYDLSGQGGSTRLLTSEWHDEQTAQFMQHVDSFDLYLQDAHAFLENLVLPYHKGRLYLGGYSTGGHIALRYLQVYPETPIEAAFVISPLLALKLPLSNTPMSYVFWSASLFVNLESYIPGASHEDPIFGMLFEGNPYSSHQDSYLEMVNLCTLNRPHMMGGPSLGWIKAATDSMIALWQYRAVQAIRAPVLIATGGDDGVVDVSYNDQFAHLLKQSKHVFYPQGRHELFRETPEIRTQWWADFDAFIGELESE